MYLALLLLTACSPHGKIRTPGFDDTATGGHTDTAVTGDTGADTAFGGGTGTDTAFGGGTGADTGFGGGTGADTGFGGDTGGAAPIGVDVSGWDTNIDWNAVWGAGVTFAYVKATEGTYYTNDLYSDEYNGSHDAGLIRGAYHFANPHDSSGTAQADYFVDNGGGWTADGSTLPGVLDIEWDPYGSDSCYGLTPDQLTSWISDFLTEYHSRTGRNAVIYTSARYWSACIGSADFGPTTPLWVADYTSGPPALPTGWTDYTFHQVTGTGTIAGISGDADVDWFHGSMARLGTFARGTTGR